MKTCACGKTFLTIPENARFFVPDEGEFSHGWWWDCDCRSTLFLPCDGPATREMIDRENDQKEVA